MSCEILVSLLLLLVGASSGSNATRSFTIDYDNDRFVRDGKPFRYVSGSFHYFRVPSAYWKDRLLKMRAAGLNAVQTYVAWNVHEEDEGKFNFAGNADLEEFLRLSNEVGLVVILRAGPYICGEWESGGFPGWLSKNPHIKLRSSDPNYLSAVDTYMAQLLPRVRPLLYENGGPVIMVQVENEYGSFPTCDKKYLEHLEQLFRGYLGSSAILFTTDGPSTGLLRCGTLDSLFSTVDFGPGTNVNSAFNAMRLYQQHGPLVNSEYYTGWLDHWGGSHAHRSDESVAATLDEILHVGASVNMYMFEGGTNFAFMNGANYGGHKTASQPTSYDYNAPLSEAGDPRSKLTAIRNVISKYYNVSGPVPPALPKFAYGDVKFTQAVYLLDALDQLTPGGPVTSYYPLTMEQLGQNYGFVLYRGITHESISQPADEIVVELSYLHDRATVLLNREHVVTVEGMIDEPVSFDVYFGHKTLDFLVENTGRINYGALIGDRKGIVGNVTYEVKTMTNWSMWSIPLKNVSELPLVPLTSPTMEIPKFFQGTFQVPANMTPEDTFLSLHGWNKGQAFINDFNLGRYWPVAGPQKTLYVPATVLKPHPQLNVLVILELIESPCGNDLSQCKATLVDTPDIGATPSKSHFSSKSPSHIPTQQHSTQHHSTQHHSTQHHSTQHHSTQQPETTVVSVAVAAIVVATIVICLQKRKASFRSYRNVNSGDIVCDED
ncbi:beta-galactosidase-like isoform X2 [Corticium candelabrum]|uniref:beta-galactosidase-like isoform X2 n=1 Tax=Corticium candelabrum TaxID=121492 RepID=UPI002E252781|nr:beta-galactosidase-like isoform X2 [Corticium candelabrum]